MKAQLDRPDRGADRRLRLRLIGLNNLFGLDYGADLKQRLLSWLESSRTATPMLAGRPEAPRPLYVT
jgi:hypothetical protein